MSNCAEKLKYVLAFWAIVLRKKIVSERFCLEVKIISYFLSDCASSIKLDRSFSNCQLDMGLMLALWNLGSMRLCWRSVCAMVWGGLIIRTTGPSCGILQQEIPYYLIVTLAIILGNSLLFIVTLPITLGISHIFKYHYPSAMVWGGISIRTTDPSILQLNVLLLFLIITTQCFLH